MNLSHAPLLQGIAGRRVICVLLALCWSAVQVTPAIAEPRTPSLGGEISSTGSQVPWASQTAPSSPGVPPALSAAIIGDRQRMVQVAMIFMGVAILILTRGNRF
jgi:hypothetical protein